MATRYPDSKDTNSFSNGVDFQDFVARYLLTQHGIVITFFQSREYQYKVGESVQGIEVKLDRLCTRTGRLSVEIAEKAAISRANFSPSGIYRDDNTWLYVQGNYDLFFVFAKTTLKLLHSTHRYEEKEEPTVRAFYLPIEDARRYAALICEVGSNNPFLGYLKEKQP